MKKREGGEAARCEDSRSTATPADRRGDAAGASRSPLTVSIIINTYNRASSLENTLQALQRQNYFPFEVIVVNGPSDDGTEELLDRHRAWIRVGTCQDRNLSVSRNVGISMARGDVVAFLDDDAVPDENWLRELVPAFEDPEVGGACGVIFDHTGYHAQYQNVTCTRLADANLERTTALPDLSFPFTANFPHLMGVSAFRRNVLHDVGGFDEEYDYFLDETDLCVRIVDSGYRLAHVDGAYVYHYSRPSHLRNANRVILNWYPIIKNKIYFCCKNALGQGYSFEAVSQSVRRRVQEARDSLEWSVREDGLDPAVLKSFQEDVKRAWEVGLAHGLNQPRRLMDSEAAEQARGPVAYDALGSKPGTFLPVPTILPAAEKLTICLLSKAYPPTGVGGIATFTVALAQGLAEIGHIVHVLTRSPYGHTTVEFEHGVWVHRVVVQDHPYTVPAQLRAAPHIWNYSQSMLEEKDRLARFHPVDIVVAPLWDSEGIAFVVDGSCPVVTTLHTPFRVACASNDWAAADENEKQFHEALVSAEEHVLTHSTGISANSRAVIDTIRRYYGIDCATGQHVVIPHGIDPPPLTPAFERHTGIMALFVGRIEKRKGVDTLLATVPVLCEKHPEVRFCIAGEEVDPAIRMAFLERHKGRAFLERVEFLGQVPDRRLESLYASCDLFVAPSRYESFGLIYLEAMRYGKPVVGCRVGGVVEVVDDGVSGFLVEPDDPPALQTALESLLADPERRRRMGQAAKTAFLERFTRRQMVEAAAQYYQHILTLDCNSPNRLRFTPWSFCIPHSERIAGRCRIPLGERDGFIVYGPYLTLRPGSYSALFDCSIETPACVHLGFALEFDVTVSWCGRTFSLQAAAVSDFRPGETRRLLVPLDFRQPDRHTLVEFRIRSTQKLPGALLTFGSVTVRPQDPLQ
ncbi:MAG: glycosyltransferase [Bryobacteraceae bacterium]